MLILQTVADKNIALVISAIIAIGVLLKQSSLTKDEFSSSMQSSLAGAGVIILITSAGGAFGQMLKMTGVASLVQELPLHSPTLILTLAFLITTAIRTAQGSSTVAMITAVGLFSPLVGEGILGVHPVYIALAIGCGSKPIAWMNDSGFWVITRMSGMTEKEGLKFITPLSAAMAVTGLIVVLIAAGVYPGV
jgi:GntP family gluconate:H+ symporter